MCTILEKLKFLGLAPLLQLSFLCFGVAKIAIYLFSYTAANALIIEIAFSCDNIVLHTIIGSKPYLCNFLKLKILQEKSICKRKMSLQNVKSHCRRLLVRAYDP